MSQNDGGPGGVPMKPGWEVRITATTDPALKEALDTIAAFMDATCGLGGSVDAIQLRGEDRDWHAELAWTDYGAEDFAWTDEDPEGGTEMSQNDGGPAFPVHKSSMFGDSTEHHGLTMRDWFAGQALAASGGYADDGPLARLWGLLWSGPTMTDEEIAERCYNQADAMLRARGGTE